jgi:hypothetical protein
MDKAWEHSVPVEGRRRESRDSICRGGTGGAYGSVLRLVGIVLSCPLHYCRGSEATDVCCYERKSWDRHYVISALALVGRFGRGLMIRARTRANLGGLLLLGNRDLRRL